jgi:hypothetical protein
MGTEVLGDLNSSTVYFRQPFQPIERQPSQGKTECFGVIFIVPAHCGRKRGAFAMQERPPFNGIRKSHQDSVQHSTQCARKVCAAGQADWIVVPGRNSGIKKENPCVISGFLPGINGIFALLGFYTAYIGGHRRFGTTYRSHLQGSSILLGLLYHWK